MGSDIVEDLLFTFIWIVAQQFLDSPSSLPQTIVIFENDWGWHRHSHGTLTTEMFNLFGRLNTEYDFHSFMYTIKAILCNFTHNNFFTKSNLYDDRHYNFSLWHFTDWKCWSAELQIYSCTVLLAQTNKKISGTIKVQFR